MKKILLFLLLLLAASGSIVSAQEGSSQTTAPRIHQRYSPQPYEMSQFHRYYDFCAIEFENMDDVGDFIGIDFLLERRQDR